MSRSEPATDSRTCHYTRHEWRLVESRDPPSEAFERVLVYRCRACEARTERRVPDTPRIDLRWLARRLTDRRFLLAVLAAALVVVWLLL